MIDRSDFGNFTITCDHCGWDEDIESGEHDWDDVMEFISDNEWTSHKTKSGWEHICPECSDA